MDLKSTEALTSNITTNDDNATTPTPTTMMIDGSSYVVVASLIILIIGTIGNTSVLFVFSKGWKKRKVCELFMINLAVSHLYEGSDKSR